LPVDACILLFQFWDVYHRLHGKFKEGPIWPLFYT
jgi:hypothetical protein